MPTEAAVKAEEALIHVLWINAGLSCDGDSVALTAATQPTIEEIALGALPGLPQVAVHWPLIDFECGPAGGADDAPARRGYGLIGLAERVGFAGGTLRAGPGPDGGYRVEVTLPAVTDRVVT